MGTLVEGNLRKYGWTVWRITWEWAWTLSRWYWLHLQSLAHTPFPKRVDVRQADWSKKYLPNLYLFLLPTLIPLSGIGRTCFHYVVIKIRHLFLRPPAWRQPSLKRECVLSTANAAGTNGLKCFPKHGGDNKFWSFILWMTFDNVA
jgi:hypothetical protein